MQRALPQLLRLLFISTTLLLSPYIIQAGVVCRSEGGIEGFESEYKKAEKFVGSETHSVSGMDVYITVQGDYLYLHSNYLTGNSKVPTKMATERADADLFNLVFNLVGPEERSGVSLGALKRGIGDITFYIEQKFFNDLKFRSLSFDSAKKLLIIDSGGKARSTMQLKGNDGRSHLVMEFQPSLYAGVNQPNVNTLNSLYESLAFRQEDVRLLPLTVDSVTVAKIKEKIPQGNTINFDLNSNESLDRSLSAHRGTTVFALGHIEGDSFAVRDAGNNVVFTIALAELEALAKRHNISIFALGCNSAASTRRVGILNAFNTVDAVNRFHDAMSADTYIRFFDKLAAQDIFILLDESVLGAARERLAMKIYTGNGGGGNGGGGNGGGGSGGGGKGRGSGSRPSPVGKIIILNPTAYQLVAPQPTPSPTPQNGAMRRTVDIDTSTQKSDGGSGLWVWVLGGVIAASGIWGITKYLSNK